MKAATWGGPSSKPGNSLKPWKKAALIALVYFAVFSVLDLLRHFSYVQNSNDVAVFDQSLWWLLHGRGLYNSLEQTSHLGIHWSPVLFLLAPVYALFPSPVTLILCQAAAGALAVFAVFLIAKRVLDDRAGVTFALLFALYHPLHGVTWDLLNELCYVIPPLLFAFYGLIAERWWLMWLGLFVALLCKEEVGFTVGFFGIYAAALGYKSSQKSLIAQGVALFAIGFAWTFLALDVFIPHFKGGPYRYFTVENRYADFGTSMGAILIHLAAHPVLLLKTIFTRPKIFYCIELLAPLAFVPLIYPAPLFMAVPSLAANLLSSAAMMSMTGARYPAVIIPFVFVAGIYGTKKLMSRSKDPEKTFRKITRTQLIFTLICTLFFSATPLRVPFRIPRITAHDAEIRKLIAEIPAGAVVSTQPDFTGHIPHGCDVHPSYRAGAQYILLDPSFPQWYRDSGMTVREISSMKSPRYALKDSAGGAMLFIRTPEGTDRGG